MRSCLSTLSLRLQKWHSSQHICRLLDGSMCLVASREAGQVGHLPLSKTLPQVPRKYWYCEECVASGNMNFCRACRSLEDDASALVCDNRDCEGERSAGMWLWGLWGLTCPEIRHNTTTIRPSGAQWDNGLVGSVTRPAEHMNQVALAL